MSATRRWPSKIRVIWDCLLFLGWSSGPGPYLRQVGTTTTSIHELASWHGETRRDLVSRSRAATQIGLQGQGEAGRRVMCSERLCGQMIWQAGGRGERASGRAGQQASVMRQTSKQEAGEGT
jgi:hypothetical protein